jgi:hypothetical protein
MLFFKFYDVTISKFEYVKTSTTLIVNSTYLINWGYGSLETWNSCSSKKHLYYVDKHFLAYIFPTGSIYNTNQLFNYFVYSPDIGFKVSHNFDISKDSIFSIQLIGNINISLGTTYGVNFSKGISDNKIQENLLKIISHCFDKDSFVYIHIVVILSILNSLSKTLKNLNLFRTAVVREVGSIFVPAIFKVVFL